MKKVYLLTAVVAIVTVACTKNELPEISSEVQSFTVSMPELNKETDTKTGLVLDGGKYNKLVWKNGDQLYVAYQSSLTGHGTDFIYDTYTTTNDGTTEAVFTKTSGSATGSGDYVVVYTGPTDYGKGIGEIFNAQLNQYFTVSIPTHQTYVANGIAPLTMPMYAKSASLDDLSFECCGNIVRLNLYNGGSDVIKVTGITLSTTDPGNTGYNTIGGPFAFIISKIDTDTLKEQYGIWSAIGSSDNGSNSITLDCGEGTTLSTDSEAPTSFNIVISRYHYNAPEAGGTSYIKATIAYELNGVAQTAKEVTLTSLIQDKRKELGKIYSFKSKDILSL